MNYNEAHLKIEILKAKLTVLQTEIITNLIRQYNVHGNPNPSVVDEEIKSCHDILKQIEDIEKQIDE